jgi:hypothetical protein
MGNISEYGVTFADAVGQPASLDLSSAGTTVVKLAGGVEVENVQQVGRKLHDAKGWERRFRVVWGRTGASTAPSSRRGREERSSS